MRFADDYVCCFQYHNDAKRFYDVLDKRLGKFGLELSPEKTRKIKFTRFETENNNSFTFLGFEYRWGVGRTGKSLVKMRTSKKKFRLAIAAILKWIKEERSKLRTAALFMKLKQKLQGHCNYYGVNGNYDMLDRFYRQVCRIMYKWLNRRTQKKSCNWVGFNEMLIHFKIPGPRIIGYWD